MTIGGGGGGAQLHKRSNKDEQLQGKSPSFRRVLTKRPHKGSGANLKHQTCFHYVQRGPEGSEGSGRELGHSQKIVPGLEALTNG